MKEKLKKILYSDRFVILLGLVVIPICSFILINISGESPLYTSISRIAWINGYWFATFVWAVVLMSSIIWLTFRMVQVSPLPEKKKSGFIKAQLINICLVFVGCLAFPAKSGNGSTRLVNYFHDYITISGWALYVIGLIIYSFLLRKKNEFLSFLGISIMGFVVLSSLFFIGRVIDPHSYVGASAVSEVYIINGLLIYLVMMYVAEQYANKLSKLDGDE